MPELPEVEAVATALRPLVRGSTIRRGRVIHPIAVRPSSQRWRHGGKGAEAAARKFVAQVRGRKIIDVERRGKYLLLRLDRGYVVLHFRLDGQLVWFDSHKIKGHVDVAFHTSSGTLGFLDRRHFGRASWVENLEDAQGVNRLGVDPLAKEFTSEHLIKILASSRRPLKEILLDQAESPESETSIRAKRCGARGSTLASPRIA